MPKTKHLSIEDPRAIPTAKKIVENHGIIAFPTDTVYGVAANIFSSEGIQKIYAAKERPDEKALPVLIGDLSQLNELVSFMTDDAKKIAKAFWPGPLTLILHKNPHLPPDLSPYPTIGIRMPDLAFTRHLLKETGPLATTSANISGGANPTTAQDVNDQLGGRVDLILDGGATPGPTASTVVDMTASVMKVLRKGPIDLSDLQALIN